MIAFSKKATDQRFSNKKFVTGYFDRAYFRTRSSIRFLFGVGKLSKKRTQSAGNGKVYILCRHK